MLGQGRRWYGVRKIGQILLVWLFLLHNSFMKSNDSTATVTAAALPTDTRCNTGVTRRITTSDILTVLELFLGIFVPPSLLPQVLPAFTSSIVRYDVAVYKLCGSCSDTWYPSASHTNAVPPLYCQQSTPGYSANHSSLLFVPLLPSNNNKNASSSSSSSSLTDLPLTGQLRLIMSFHGATLTAQQAPSDVWPSDLGVALSQLNMSDPVALGTFIASVQPSLSTLFGASAGAIGIVPDYLGFGASIFSNNRSFAVPVLYQQAAMVSYWAAQRWLEECTSNCTVLTPVATTLGYSEGSFASIAANQAMTEAGVRVLTNFAAVPLLDMDKATAFAVSSFNQGLISPTKNNAFLGSLVAFPAFAYSIGNPVLANSGYPNQTALNPEWMMSDNLSHNVIDWFAAPYPLPIEQIFPMLPPFAPQVLNAAFLELIFTVTAQNMTSPCRDGIIVPGVTDKLCETYLQASVYSILANTTTPTRLCYSVNDTIIPTYMFPDSVFQNSMVTKNSNVFGAPVEADHIIGGLLCLVQMLETLAPTITTGNVTTNSSTTKDHPTTILPLRGAAATTCPVISSFPPWSTAPPAKTQDPSPTATSQTSDAIFATVPCSCPVMILSLVAMTLEYFL